MFLVAEIALRDCAVIVSSRKHQEFSRSDANVGYARKSIFKKREYKRIPSHSDVSSYIHRYIDWFSDFSPTYLSNDSFQRGSKRFARTRCPIEIVEIMYSYQVAT